MFEKMPDQVKISHEGIVTFTLKCNCSLHAALKLPQKYPRFDSMNNCRMCVISNLNALIYFLYLIND